MPGASVDGRIARAALGLLVPERDVDWTLVAADGLYQLTGRLPGGGGSRAYTIDPAIWRVVRVVEFDADGRQIGEQDRQAFDTVDGVVLPRRVRLTGQGTTVELEHRRLVVNPDDLRLRFVRPDGLRDDRDSVAQSIAAPPSGSGLPLYLRPREPTDTIPPCVASFLPRCSRRAGSGRPGRGTGPGGDPSGASTALREPDHDRRAAGAAGPGPGSDGRRGARRHGRRDPAPRAARSRATGRRSARSAGETQTLRSSIERLETRDRPGQAVVPAPRTPRLHARPPQQPGADPGGRLGQPDAGARPLPPAVCAAAAGARWTGSRRRRVSFSGREQAVRSSLEETQRLLQQGQAEQQRLAQSRREREALVTDLRGRRGRLERDLEQRKTDAQQLSSLVQDLVAQERRRAEAERQQREVAARCSGRGPARAEAARRAEATRAAEAQRRADEAARVARDAQRRRDSADAAPHRARRPGRRRGSPAAPPRPAAARRDEPPAARPEPVPGSAGRTAAAPEPARPAPARPAPAPPVADRPAPVDLTGSFRQNRGSLPWPVDGTVTGRFGDAYRPGVQHPDLVARHRHHGGGGVARAVRVRGRRPARRHDPDVRHLRHGDARRVRDALRQPVPGGREPGPARPRPGRWSGAPARPTSGAGPSCFSRSTRAARPSIRSAGSAAAKTPAASCAVPSEWRSPCVGRAGYSRSSASATELTQ